MRSMADGLARFDALDIQLPDGPLADHPVSWFLTPNGRTLHTYASCKKIPKKYRSRPELEERLATVRDVDASRICESCVGGRREQWLETRLDAAERIGRAKAVRASNRTGWDLYEHAAFQSAAFADLMRSASDDNADDALAGALVPYHAEAVGFELEALAEARRIDPDGPLRAAVVYGMKEDPIGTAAAEMELGINPSYCFNSHNSGSSYAWRHAVPDIFDAWQEVIADGGTQEAAIAAGVARGEWRWTQRGADSRGSDPTRLVYSGADFDSPSAWSDAEHEAAKERMIRAACTAWYSAYEHLLRKSRRQWKVVTYIILTQARYGQVKNNERDTRIRRMLAATYPTYVGRDATLMAVPEPVAEYLHRTAYHAETIGTWRKRQTAEVLSVADMLTHAGSDAGPALDAAQHLLAH